MQDVDTSTLEKTVANLVRALRAFESHSESELREVLRSGVVQNFGTCWGRIRPTLTRSLALLDGLDPETLKEMSLGQLLRTANEYGYSSFPWEEWKRFLEARNESAHAYNEPVAEAILTQAPRLVQAANEVLAAVRRKQA